MRIERAAPEDMRAVRAIAARYDLMAEWPAPPDWLEHVLAMQGLWVARDNGEVCGFAGVVRDGGVTHLCDLFVEPDRLGRGTGKALLAAALPATGVRTTFASADPRALTLYVRAGLRPFAPLLYLAGAVAAGGATERVPVASVPSGRPAARGFLATTNAYALRAGDGSAVVRPVPGGALLGPGVADAGAVLAIAGAASAEYGTVKLALPGPHPALAPLLAAGMQLKDADTFMATE